MSDLISNNHLKIRYNLIYIFFILIFIVLLGYFLLHVPEIGAYPNLMSRAISGSIFLIIEELTTFTILKSKGIKSKDDFSQAPRCFITNYYNVKKNMLVKIFLIPNIIYTLALIALTFTINHDYQSLIYWVFTFSACYLVFNISRILKIENK